MYEGESGIRQIYGDTISSLSQGDTIFGFSGDIKTNYISEKDLEIYIKARIDKRIRNKVILAPSAYADSLKKGAEAQLREVKIFTETKSLNFPSVDIKIYGNKIAIISHRENFLGVLIESKDISQMCKIIFESLWNSLPKE